MMESILTIILIPAILYVLVGLYGVFEIANQRDDWSQGFAKEGYIVWIFVFINYPLKQLRNLLS